MKLRITSYILAFVLLAVVACSRESGRQRVPKPTDSLYTEKNVLNIYDSLPGQALLMLDSAVIVGNMTDLRADILRTKVYSSSCEEAHYDSAIIIGERLMHHDFILAHPDLQEEVLNNLVYACRLLHDDERALYWATQLGALYRQQDETTEALRTDAEIGKFLVKLGHQQNGMARIDSVVHELKGKRRFNELDASIIALKRKAEICYEKGLHAEMIPAAQHMLDLLDDYEQHPDEYHDGSYREQTAEQRPHYIDFYRAKAYGYLAMAFLKEAPLSSPLRENSARQADSGSAVAKRYVELFDQTNYGKTLDGRYFIALTAGRLGQYDRMLATYDEYEPAFICDTHSFPYAELLYNRAEAAAAQGRHADAYELMERYAALTKLLNDSLQQGKANLYAARFHAQEQQEEIDRQRAFKQYAAKVAWLIGILAIMGLLFAWYACRQWRKMQLKNRVLARQMKDTIIYKNRYAEAPHSVPEGATDVVDSIPLDALSPEELFSYIEREVSRRQLFLNPSFDRQMIMDEFHLSKERVGAAFSQGSQYNSLPQFVSDLRLEYACKLLVTTDLTVSEIMAKAGFSNASVFSRYFSRKFQISPTQYRRLNSEQ